MEHQHQRGARARGGQGKGKLTTRLRWELRHGTAVDDGYGAAVAEWLRERGRDVPAELIEPPAIFDDLAPVWIAWHTLSISRPAGMAATGIPWGEMSCYCADHGIDGPLRLRWIRLLRAMDLVWLTYSTDTRRRRGDGSAGSRA
jgi:hypothetical protein